MGGIGKTALAKLVINDEKVEQHFNVKAWLCVSVKVDINTLLAKIYESLTKKKPTSDLRVNLVKSLEEELASKRYLLVLDDVWVEERSYWEEFRSCMLNVNSQNGSGILVTTRKLEIGTHDMIMDSCHLKGLLENECWSIFKERAFGVGQPLSTELADLEKTGREIVEKCGGLPLLVNVIGGMLANYSDPKNWLSIKNSNVWDLKEEKDRVRKILELSFDNLPSSIAKQCFAYCSIFEKDTVMERKELIQLWMALGLVQADDARNKEMEDVGNDIFQILVSNSLFQDVRRDKYGNISGCSMHDLVHDLSLSLSKHEILCVTGATNDDTTCIHQVKHLALYQEQMEDDEFEAKVAVFIERDTVAKILHTFFFDCEVKKNFSFQRFKCMRILKLTGCAIEKIDDSIGELVHLRYLDLSFTFICVLPESIGKLYHLQTLKLHCCLFFMKFPKSMRNLINLRYCKSDESIPNNIVGYLTSLRTLGNNSFNVLKDKGHGIEQLSRLKHLSGKLCISNLEKISSKEDAVKADLSGKKKLYEIEFNWSDEDEGVNRNDEHVLEGLEPPVDVKILRINKFTGDNFPEWVTKMGMLVSITLSDCSRCLSLPTLEHIPHLRDLVLENMKNLTCLRSSGSTKPLSPSLRSLRLERMESLEKWIDGATNSSKMISPVLERLEIESCPKIILLDECHPHPLVSLKIWNCTGLVSVKSMQGLTSLVSLVIDHCDGLLEINKFPNQCYSLKTLSISFCNNLASFPHKIFDSFAFLNTLKLGPFSKELNYFQCLQGIEKLKNLHTGELRGWDHWELILEEIQLLTSVIDLTMYQFGGKEVSMLLTRRNLHSIPEEINESIDCDC